MRIVSLPAVTLVVSLVLFVALVGGVVWAWWSWVPGGVAGGGGPQDSFKDMHQKQAVAKARRILSDALLGETSSASDQSLVRLIGSLRGKRLYAQQEDSELVRRVRLWLGASLRRLGRWWRRRRKLMGCI